MSQLSGVVHILTHPTVQHQPEVRTAFLTHIGNHGGIFTDTGITVMRPPMGWHFTADKAKFFSQVRASTGGIELNLFAYRATQQLVYRQVDDFTEQIP